MTPHKSYNRNASTLEESPPQLTYAEALIDQKGFRFQARSSSTHEEKVDLRAISKVDIDKIIKDGDLEEVLGGLLENITFGELTEDDFDLYSSK